MKDKKFQGGVDEKMNIWVIVAIVVGLLAITGLAVSALSTASETEETQSAECGNSCNKERNCGSSTCGAVYGKTCGCGR